MQISIFDGSQPFKITKPIRLIELFGGYGSQALALKYLGANFEHWKLCEWAIKSIQAYKDAHFKDNNTDYSKDFTKEQIIEYLAEKGISANYNEPMTKQQVERMGEQKLKQVYNNIQATHNLVDICQAHAKDLEIVDTDKYTYVMTYSFPCQDLSLAGKGAGMEKGSGTRSGLLWEVERLLDESLAGGALPQVLLMENVPEVMGVNNIKHFAKWLEKLESIGYKCYWKVLNAKDYGVPQNRERCFMVSILGDYYYNFPQPKKLEKKLKDLLEDIVDEKFYLSEKALMGKLNTNFNCSSLSACMPNKDGIMPTLCARDYKDPKCVQVAQIEGKFESTGRVYSIDGLSPTLNTCGGGGREPKIAEEGLPIKNATKQGYLMAEDGDGVDISGRMASHRGTVQKGMAQTLNTNIDVGVVVQAFSETEKKLFTEDGNIKRYINSDIVDKFEEGQMATTTFPNGYGHGPRTHDESIALNTIDRPVVKNNLRIRKLVPIECFRLMGVKDDDYKKIAENQSNASLYHLAGDSIVVDVLMAIFKQML